MKIVNTATNETVCEIMTTKVMGLDETISLIGSIINDMADELFSDDGDNVIIDGNRYFYDDLSMVY